MHNLYKEKGDKFSLDKTKQIGKPKKILISSKGYNEYLNKFSNDNYSHYYDLKKMNNNNHKKIENSFYNKENKYKPDSSSTENYNREFESDIFNIKNTNYSKYIKLNKGHKKVNKSIDTSISRNTRVKGFLKWPANISWTQDSEAMFRLNAKNERRNQSMTAYVRDHVDSVRKLIKGRIIIILKVKNQIRKKRLNIEDLLLIKKNIL